MLPLSSHKSPTDVWLSRLTTVIRGRPNRSVVLIGVLAVLLILTAVLTRSHAPLTTWKRPGRYTFESRQPLINHTPSFLHLLIPATKSDQFLCQTVLSGFALDYPNPVLINWEHEVDAFRPYHAHILKVAGVLRYLKSLPTEKDEDLVLLIDGLDVWLQLRPSILIERYFTLIDAADERARRTLGLSVMEQRRNNVTHSIVFGADKGCWPQAASAPACYAVPASTLPVDVWGDKTDHDSSGVANRPRWLNSGAVIGPVKDLRALFERAQEKIENSFAGDRDQWYFAEIFGEQEYYRAELQKADWQEGPSEAPSAGEQQEEKGQTVGHLRRRELQRRWIDSTTIEGEKRLPELPTNAITEFHIAIDYESALFHTMTHATDDVAWLSFNSTEEYLSALKEQDMGADRLIRMPLDVALSDGPYRTMLEGKALSAKESDALPAQLGWEDVSLAVNLRSKQVPVLLHINGDKRFLDTFWPRMWFWRFRRLFLKAALRGKSVARPFLWSETMSNSYRTWWKAGDLSWWREGGQHKGFWTADRRWLTWETVCSEHRSAIFGDNGEED